MIVSAQAEWKVQALNLAPVWLQAQALKRIVLWSEAHTSGLLLSAERGAD